MNKLVSVTARLGADSLKYIEKTSRMFDIDRSSVLRNILAKGIKEDKKEKALDLYIKGKFSISEASNFAGIYIGEFLDLLKEKGIESNLTLDDFKESLENISKLKK